MTMPRVGITPIAVNGVLMRAEQSILWSGVKTNFLISWDGKLIPNSTLAANLHTKQELFEQYVPYAFATCSYESPEIDIGQNGRAWISAEIVATAGRGATLQHAPHLFIDTRGSADAYTGFTEWVTGNRLLRYAKFRLEMHSVHGRAVVQGFKPVVDATQGYDVQITAASGYATITTIQ